MRRCMVLAALTASIANAAAAQVTSDSAFKRILAEYKKLGPKPGVEALVKIDSQVYEAIAAFQEGVALARLRAPSRPLRLTEDFSELGVSENHYNSDVLDYSSKLLREAHLADPNSKWRSVTLFATTEPEQPDSLDPLAQQPKRAYLEEFPQGANANRIVVSIALFYDDLYKMVRDSMKGPGQMVEYKVECFKPYFTKAPLPEQLQAARDSAVRYYERAVARQPSSPTLREQLMDMRAGRPVTWHHCPD